MERAVRLGLIAVAAPLEVGAEDAPALWQRAQAALDAAGLDRLELYPFRQPVTDFATAAAAGRAFYEQRVDAVCAVACSWFQDYLVLDLLAECDVPIIAWARPGMETGALCGVQQLGFILKQLGHPYTLHYGEIGADDGVQRVWDYARAAALRGRLRRARIGYLGHRVEGMTETTAHELALKKLLGPRVVGLSPQVFLERAAQVPPESVAERWEALTQQVGRVAAPREAGIYSLQVYTALQETIAEAGLAALTIGCYPDIFGKACLAASLLGEEGFPVACEGDVNGAVGMLMLTDLAAAPVHCTDALDPIAADNALVYSHCGSGGFSLAPSLGDVTLGTIRLMGGGLCCLFPARAGFVTLINLIPTLTGYRLAVLTGEAIPTDMIFPGNPLRVQFQADYRDILAWIAAEGLGHHWMAAYGDLRASLKHLAAMTGVDYVAM